jgi:hypothetical protein
MPTTEPVVFVQSKGNESSISSEALRSANFYNAAIQNSSTFSPIVHGSCMKLVITSCVFAFWTLQELHAMTLSLYNMQLYV